ncbi:hypothetical protein F6Q07_22530 [Pectobacterium parmentieri]|uniref:hypothetical protein n=1 Tax=Pectobacterium parmentieri TaxID=1905730 RepID=UPI000EAFEF09|nr:hypothetical protein [Pectobacterium parmentieri]AYH33266.1 hypothetical protein C5E19_17460 [Pectobacterium parmentieri]MBI0520844.1 hypothetical protein [Pectobacterium parmentieri]QQA77027.1 hypothetical protein JBL47_05340 [Pectobacterium parmentieri]
MKQIPFRTDFDVDKFLMTLSDDDRTMIDKAADAAFKSSSIDHRIIDAIYEASLAPHHECATFVSTDEYKELATNFIVDLVYLFEVHRMRKQSADLFGDAGTDNRRLM